MKVKRAIAVMVILVGLLGVFASGASAAEAWYWCKVNNTGSGFGNYYVNLADQAAAPAFAAKWYILNPTQYKEFLAIALTAITSDMVVMVYVDPTEYSTVKAMYIQQ